MIRLVPDTNILISSIFWRGNPHKVIVAGFKEECLLITSPEIIDELINKLKSKFKVPDERIETLLNIILHFFFIVKPKQKLDVVKADPTDNKVIECTVEGKADYIVNGDPHLLNLEKYGEIKIIKAKQMLDILK